MINRASHQSGGRPHVRGPFHLAPRLAPHRGGPAASIYNAISRIALARCRIRNLRGPFALAGSARADGLPTLAVAILLCGVQKPPTGLGGHLRRWTPHIHRRHITHSVGGLPTVTRHVMLVRLADRSGLWVRCGSICLCQGPHSFTLLQRPSRQHRARTGLSR